MTYEELINSTEMYTQQYTINGRKYFFLSVLAYVNLIVYAGCVN